MSTRPGFVHAACALAALVTIAAAAGNDQPQQPPAQQLPIVQPPPQPPATPVIDLTFNGGTVLDYVAALRKAAGDANIVVAPEAAKFPMPAVTLRHVTVPAALAVLKDRTTNDGVIFIQLDVGHVPSFNPEERPTYQVMARIGGGRNVPPASQSTRVWTISSLLGTDLTSHKLLSAVETAVEVVGAAAKPDVRFHEDTGLLIARGNEDQIAAINDVIEQLKLAKAGQVDERIAVARQKMDEYKHMLQECQATLQALQQKQDNGAR